MTSSWETWKKEPWIAQDILEQSIWINKDIIINNKCIFWKSWKNAGILYINDIINKANGHFLTHKELQKKCNIKTNQILTLQIYSSIPKDWIKILKEKVYSSPLTNIQNRIEINNSKNIKCKDFYWHLINNNCHKPKAISSWENTFINFRNKDKISGNNI